MNAVDANPRRTRQRSLFFCMPWPRCFLPLERCWQRSGLWLWSSRPCRSFVTKPPHLIPQLYTSCFCRIVKELAPFRLLDSKQNWLATGTLTILVVQPMLPSFRKEFGVRNGLSGYFLRGARFSSRLRRTIQQITPVGSKISGWPLISYNITHLGNIRNPAPLEQHNSNSNSNGGTFMLLPYSL